MIWDREEKANDVLPVTHTIHYGRSETKNMQKQLSPTLKNDVTITGVTAANPMQTPKTFSRPVQNNTPTKKKKNYATIVTETNVTKTPRLKKKPNQYQLKTSAKRNLYHQLCQEETPVQCDHLSKKNDEKSSTLPDDEFYNLDVIFDNKYSKGPTYKSIQFQLKQEMSALGIYNEMKFQHMIKHSSEFADLVTRMPCNQLENVKKQMYQVVRETTVFKSYEERLADIQVPSFHNDDFTVGLSTFIEIVESIATENKTTLPELMTNFFKIMNMVLPKRNTIVFIGKSNSGKTVIAEVLLKIYPIYDIGWFNLPPSRNSDQFWLEPLIGASVYRAEEVFVANEEHITKLKQLFEGNPALDAPIKYKSPIIVPRRPVIVTMNGEDEADLTRGISRERETMANRSFIYKMNTNLFNRYTEGDERLMKLYGEEITKFMYDRYGQWRPEPPSQKLVDYCVEKINEYI